MPKFFLTRKLHVFFIVLLLLSWLTSSYKIFFLGLLIYGGLLYLFRQNRLTYKDDVAFKNDVFYSPVSGVIKNVSQNSIHPHLGSDLTAVQITIAPWLECGVYLPFTSEVQELRAKRGRGHLRSTPLLNEKEEDEIGLDLVLSGVNGTNIAMKLIPCLFGGWPQIALLPGDRGKRRTNIGYFPFGGTVILYLPPEIHLLLEEGDELVAGVSVFAGLTKEHEREKVV